MKTSHRGLTLIKEFEGTRLKAYKDPVGIWTIGSGTIRYPNGSKVKGGDVCTAEQAGSYLAHDVQRFEDAVNRLVKVPLKQNQFDALVSFAYNLGEGNLGGSTLLKKVNAGDYRGAADQFPRWNRAGGKVLAGLTRRRNAERELFLS